MSPLIPLAQYPALLSLLSFFGKQTLTLMLLLVPTTIVLCFLQKNIVSYSLLTLSLLFWIISWTQGYQPLEKPHWLNTIMALPHVFFNAQDREQACVEATRTFKNIIKQNPHINLIITPESAIYFDQLHRPHLLQQWSTQALSKNIHIMIGAFRWEQNNYHNSLHWIHDGSIQHYFDKRHVMPLTERIPSLFNYPFIKDLYFKTFPQITASSKERPEFIINNDITLIPYICSELFFNDEPDDFYPTRPILAMCNDRWLVGYIPRLMHCMTRFKAILWQRPIIYITFGYQSYFDTYGNETQIKAYKSN